MLLARPPGLRFSLLCRHRCRYPILFRTFTGQPNPPLSLDPGLQALLKEEDILLGKSRPGRLYKELEVIDDEGQLVRTTEPLAAQDDFEYVSERKSPAAHYGSQRIGAVILPNQFQNTINAMIHESDKVQLHSDAKRLFYDGEGGGVSQSEWETTYDSHKYRSRKQASRHAERDGTAFASIALPAHYSAILSVFEHVKRRLEPTWKVQRIIDWGAGTGSGLWASLHAFQKPLAMTETAVQDNQVSNSTVSNYLGIDKREGLVAIGKRLFRGIDLGSLSMSWQKSFKEDDLIRRSEGHDMLAMSAFMLTSLPGGLARKALVKEMWESGAHVMVLIDHSTTTGFEAIAEAREYLLKMGRKELEDTEANERPVRGSHVVAPCPHDGACPLHNPGSNRLVCGFSQRIQRPSFVRKTKHSGVGHEDIEYSYVVIRRGPRPPLAITTFGRIGEVGKRALEKEIQINAPIKELKLHSEYDEMNGTIVETPVLQEVSVTESQSGPKSAAELEEALRLEAFSWPRLVFPPLKKSGHIILDSCTAEGKIMRLTIPRSQGKQAYYDARKSSWGDIFPHAPKNTPQARYEPTSTKSGATRGSDIGKRGQSDRIKDRPTYEALSKGLREDRKKSKKARLISLEKQARRSTSH